MWALVKVGLRTYRPVLVAAWAVCTLGIASVFAILALLGAMSPGRAIHWSASAWPLYMLLASAVPGWIAMGNEMTERRLRLHLLLPLSLREVALARLLLPVAMLAIGFPLAHAVLALSRLAEGAPLAALRHGHLDLVAAHLLFLHQISFTIKEVAVMRETHRGRAALGTLGIVAVAVADFLLGQPLGSLAARTASVLAIALATGAVNLALFQRRRSLAR